MDYKSIGLAGIFSPRKRFVLSVIFICCILVLIVLSWSLPFTFEASSIYYKFGIHKSFLRAGKVVGLTAALLIYLQVILACRSRLLDHVFSLNRLFAFHRFSGVAIVVLACIHITLILAAEKFVIFPFEKWYWPELVGVGLFLFLLPFVLVGFLRRFLPLPYELWLFMHRIGGIFAVMLLTAHILFVSETYKIGFPRYLIIFTTAMILLLLLKLWFERYSRRSRGWEISAIDQINPRSTRIEIAVPQDAIFKYFPGQFAFITPFSSSIAAEEHPFTISSSPTRPATIEFTISNSGDWTGKIPFLKPGESITVQGPFGLFSHLVNPDDEPLIMISGGIGITPMLSMLRFMADTGDPRRILLIWSNKTRDDIVFGDEFDAFQHLLPGLQIHHVFTREKLNGYVQGRLDEEMLEKLLADWDRTAKIFLCGPPAMMHSLGNSLVKLGFSAKSVYKEEFRF